MANRAILTILWAAALAGCAAAAPDPIVAPPPVRAPAAAPAPPVAPTTGAPTANAPTASAPAASGSGAASVVVIAPDKPAPPGDTRSVAERRRDRQAFDRCVIKAQAQLDKAGPSAITETPEEICYRQMGVRDRRDAPVAKP